MSVSLWHYRSSGLQVSVIETACLWLSGTDRGKSVGLCGLYGLSQTTTDIGNFPDVCQVGVQISRREVVDQQTTIAGPISGPLLSAQLAA